VSYCCNCDRMTLTSCLVIRPPGFMPTHPSLLRLLYLTTLTRQPVWSNQLAILPLLLGRVLLGVMIRMLLLVRPQVPSQLHRRLPHRNPPVKSQVGIYGIYSGYPYLTDFAGIRFKESPFFQIDQAVSPVVECPGSTRSNFTLNTN